MNARPTNLSNHAGDSAPGLVKSPVPERTGLPLSGAQAVAAHADLGALLRDLAAALGPHLPTGYISFALLDPASHSGKLQFLEPIGGAAPPRPADTPTELPASESPTAHVWDAQEPLWLDAGARADGRFAVLPGAYAKQGVRSACLVP